MNGTVFNGTEEIAGKSVGIVIRENFDSVVAPALPSDIVVSIAPGTGTATTSTDFALSGSNSLKMVGGASINNISVYSANIDNSSGNCTVSCSFYYPSSVPVSGQSAGIIIGVGSQLYVSAAGEYAYRFSIINSGTVPTQLAKSTNGAGLFLSGSSGATVFPTSTWITLSMCRNGSTLWCSCQRLDTLQWLSPTGTWQISYVAVIVYTDGSPLSSSSSYGGFYSYVNTETVYSDNFYVRDLVTTQPAGKLKGLNVTFANSLGQTNFSDLWNQFVWTGVGGIKTQIDLAKSIGCNCIRMGAGLEGIWTGTYTMVQYLSRLRQVVSYCQSKGLWYVHTEDENGPYFSAGDPTQQQDLFNGIIANLVQVAAVLASYPNVLGLDVMNEYELINQISMYNGTVTLAGTFAMSAALWEDYFQRAFSAIRVIASNLPLTACTVGTFSDAAISAHSYQFDYLDQHVYFTAGVSDSQAMYTQLGTSGKKIFISESGDAMSDGGVNRLARLNGTWNNVVNATYTGQPGCIGMCWWNMLPQSAVAANDFGMWDGANPAVARADIEPTYAGFSSQATNFPPVSNFRRRRR